jgi:hypothetical protein
MMGWDGVLAVLEMVTWLRVLLVVVRALDGRGRKE